MNIRDRLAKFQNKRILVIGDTIVDITTHCDAIGLSAETPTMVLKKRLCDERRGHYDEITYGGAALVVRNLLELGASVDFLTFAGSGAWMTDIERWHHSRLTKHLVYPTKPCGKPVTVKHRYWVDGYKMLQVDTRDDKPIDHDTELVALDTFHMVTGKFQKKIDAIVIADYRHGFLTPRLAKHFVKNTSDVSVYVSSQISQNEGNHHWYYDPGTIFVVNELESKSMVDWFGSMYSTNCVVTGGDKGARPVFTDVWTRPIQIEAIDTCGAGDAFLAAYCLTKDLKFANTWAGLSCTVKGANPPPRDMLINWYENHGQDAA